MKANKFERIWQETAMDTEFAVGEMELPAGRVLPFVGIQFNLKGRKWTPDDAWTAITKYKLSFRGYPATERGVFAIEISSEETFLVLEPEDEQPKVYPKVQIYGSVEVSKREIKRLRQLVEQQEVFLFILFKNYEPTTKCYLLPAKQIKISITDETIV